MILVVFTPHSAKSEVKTYQRSGALLRGPRKQASPRCRWAPVPSLGRVFQPSQRVNRPGHEFAPEQDSQQSASPAGEIELAVVLDATTIPRERNAVERLVHRDAERQPAV